jgi:hypothetical protein
LLGEAADLPAGGERPDRPGGGELRGAAGRVANKKPTQKNPKKHLKKPLKLFFCGVFWVFKIIFCFVKKNTNFSLWNRFLMNKKDINYHLLTKKW